MTHSRRARTVFLVVAASALLALLVFLFVKSNTAEHKSDAQALSLLRELHDIDQRWDNEALRLANTLAAVNPPLSDIRPFAMRIFHEMESGAAKAVLAPTTAMLRAGMDEKQLAFQALKKAHAQSLASVTLFRSALTTLASDVASTHARNEAGTARAGTVLGQIEQMRTALNVTDIEANAEMQRLLETPLATLPMAAASVDAALRGRALQTQAAGYEFAAARQSESEAWRRFAFLTVGSRVELMARDLGQAMEISLDDKERWRVYLAAYAAALLVGVGYLFARLMAAQVQLRIANRELESRVADRTRDLSNTLQQLKESEAQLVQSEKMSSLGQLVAGVAHEVNTPLAYVKNSLAHVRERMPELHDVLGDAERLLEIMGRAAPDPGELNEAFTALSGRLGKLAEHQVLGDLDALARDGLHGIEQISDLVTNLRNFSRVDRSRIASFNVNEGVRTTLIIAKPMLRKVEVRTHLADVPLITCSPSQVNQVLLNLLANAAQAIERPDGMVEISTRREGMDYVSFEVSDNGKGIPESALGQIFDPFYTTKEVGKGTGLGLSIAYKIVSQHGGRIDVRSEVGVGSTFKVTLPVTPNIEAGAHAHAFEEIVT